MLLVIFAVAGAACAGGPDAPLTAAGSETWGASENVTQVGRLYIASQPDQEALEIARSRGISTVINLRLPSEMDWDERSAAERLGLEYLNGPIERSGDTLDREAVAAISEALRARPGEQVLLHCSSGNRAAAWLAAHLVEDHAMSEARALDIARQAGLTQAGTEARARRYLEGN